MNGNLHWVRLTVLLALAATALTIQFVPEVRLQQDDGRRWQLPDRIGPYQGTPILYCQNEQCLKTITASGDGPGSKCPACKGQLEPLSPAEQNVLPQDTLIVRKNYTAPGRAPVLVSVVLSGADQRSIHRPQQCLPAQGMTIDGSHVIRVPRPGQSPLNVMVLDIRPSGNNSTQAPQAIRFAYWFTNRYRETPYHIERLFWMSADRLFRSQATPWAYVSVLYPGRATSEQTMAELTQFLSQLYSTLAGTHSR